MVFVTGPAFSNRDNNVCFCCCSRFTGAECNCCGPNPAPAVIHKSSFVQALRGSQVKISEPLPVPSIRGETLFVKITNDAYFRGLEVCKINLHGRLVLNKGNKPYSSKDVFAKLQKVWKVIGQWRMLSLGRGFYEFFFDLHADMRTVWAAGTVNLKSGVLRLFE